MPETRRIVALPASLGLLPIAPLCAGGGFALPLADGEAAWLAVIGPVEGLTIAALVRSGDRTVLAGLARGGMLACPGLPLRDGYIPIGRGDVVALEISRAGATTVIGLLDYAAFETATGRPPPSLISISSGYAGTRLP